MTDNGLSIIGYGCKPLLKIVQIESATFDLHDFNIFLIFAVIPIGRDL